MNKQLVGFIILGVGGYFVYRNIQKKKIVSYQNQIKEPIKEDEINFPKIDFSYFTNLFSKPVKNQTEIIIQGPYTMFSKTNFRGWFSKINPNLLTKLNWFASQWPNRIIISPAQGAIGRHLGPENTSQHNIDKWGDVRGIDVMLQDINKSDLQQAVSLAKEAGFTGIGAYPDWKPYPGLHLDVRIDRLVSNPALWSGVLVNDTQVYKGVTEAWS